MNSDLDASLIDRSLRPLLDRLSDGIAIVERRSWRVLYTNPVLVQRLNLPAHFSDAHSLNDVFGIEAATEIRSQVNALLAGGAPEVAMVSVAVGHESAGRTSVAVKICTLDLNGEKLLAFVVPAVEVQSSAGAIARDALTGLYDRQFLFEHLGKRLINRDSTSQPLTLLFIDLDDFKQINDLHGHLVGDTILREIGLRLRCSVRDGDLLARYGGDEFVVLLENMAGLTVVDAVVERIRVALSAPVALPSGPRSLSVSIGVAIESAAHHSAEDLLHDADRAMYADKRRRNGAFQNDRS